MGISKIFRKNFFTARGIVQQQYFHLNDTHQKPGYCVGNNRVFINPFGAEIFSQRFCQDSFLYYKKSGSAAAFPSASIMRT